MNLPTGFKTNRAVKVWEKFHEISAALEKVKLNNVSLEKRSSKYLDLLKITSKELSNHTFRGLVWNYFKFNSSVAN